MLDVVAIVSFLILFSACLFYVQGCDFLKGKRS